MIFGERIKQLRTERQWTQEYVCERLNISAGALSRYETGMYEPKSLELVKDFANLFEVSTDYLLGKSDIRTSNQEGTPQARAIARGFDKLPPDKQKVYTELLNTLLNDEDTEA